MEIPDPRWFETWQDWAARLLETLGPISTSSGGGGSNSIIISEVDGTPSGASIQLVFPNGTLTILAGVATYTPAAAGGTVTHTGPLTNHAPLVGNGLADIRSLSVMLDGQLLIGVTGADPLIANMSGDATMDNTGAVTLAPVPSSNIALIHRLYGGV